MKSSFFAGCAYMYANSSRRLANFCHSVAGHFSEQRSLAVDHFIVRQRQDEVFMPCVKHAERQFVVMKLAMDGIPAACISMCRASSPCPI